MRIEVRPLPVSKWHEKSGEDSFTRPKTVEVLYDSLTGKYKTGLTEEEAKKYGKLLGVDLSDTFYYEQPHPYWSSKAGQIKLENYTKFYNTDIPADYVKIKNMRASKHVANSFKEWEEGLWPFATHVIFDEEEEVSVKASKIEKEEKAVLISSKLNSEEKSYLVQLITNKTVRGKSPNFINVALKDAISKDIDTFLSYAQMDKKEVYVRASILEAIHRNILTKEGTAIYYMSDLIGMDMDSAISWFTDPQNSKMKIAILDKLNK